jgi:hypothetical protein
MELQMPPQITASENARAFPMTTPENSTLNIFLSCPVEDVVAARKIGTQLDVLGRGRLKIFVSDYIPFGEEYRPRVLQELALADRLILMYTDPYQDWDSCLYESGFFDGRAFPNSKMRLVVLHDTDPPTPLNGFNPVKVSRAEREPLQKFIKEIFCEPIRVGLEPINPKVMDEDYSAIRGLLEDAIIEAILGGQQKHEDFGTEIRIDVPENTLRDAKDDKVPDKAQVFGDSESFKLFDLRANKEGYPWKEFAVAMDKMSDNTEDWVGSLANMMKRIAFSTARLDSPGLPLYRSRLAGANVYRPSIRSFRNKKGTLSFKVLFSDLPEATTIEPPGVATTLAQALTAARMFRWGVLQRLQQSITDSSAMREAGRLTADEWAQSVATELEHFVDQKLTVMVESLNRGYRREDLLSHFEPVQQVRVKSLLDQWDLFCAGTKELSDRLRGNGKPVVPVELMETIESALEMNKQFMIACIDRYKEAIESL